MLRVGYFSDAHLEHLTPHPYFFRDEHPDIGGDVLIVAGDLTGAPFMQTRRTDPTARSIKKMVERMQRKIFSKYNVVLYVMGNHEHYGAVFSKTKEFLREYFDGTNVIILDNDHWVHQDGTIFLGCTLWSDFMKASPISMEACQNGMNDFNLIYRKDPYDVTYVERKQYHNGRNPAAVTASFILDEHLFSKKYIGEVVKNYPDRNIVVLTHHGPTYKSLNQDHIGNGIDGAYASDLSDLIMDNPQIKFWVHGHTHQSEDYMVGECRVLANQIGYKGERSFFEFEGIKHFEI